MKDKQTLLIAVIVFALIGGLLVIFHLSQREPEVEIQPTKPVNDKVMNQTQNKTWSTPPAMTIDTNRDYQAIITTSAGQITIDLAEGKTPLTVNNFVFLANEGFYEGIIFHRVINGFMIQTGCPQGNGTGDPGYRFADEEFSGAYQRGVVAMANAGPDTNGSQFFIMQSDVDLPADYVIFGQVTDGLAVVDEIAQAPVGINASGEESSPLDPVTIEKIEIVAQ